MSDPLITDDFQTVLSLDPLLDFWREKVAPKCIHQAEMFRVFENRVQETPALRGDIADAETAAARSDILSPLMTVAFPSATWDTEIAAAFKPFTHQVLYCTPGYRRHLVDANGLIAGRRKDDFDALDTLRRVKAYSLILQRLYDIDQGAEAPFIRVVSDPDTGLERYFQVTPDFQFIRVGTVGTPIELSDEERRLVIEHVTDPTVLTTVLPPENFVFRGFTVVRAVDVTASEITSAVERDLIDQKSIFSAEGFSRLQERLRTLFGKPSLKAGLAAVQGEQVLVLNDGHRSTANCLFRNSNHIPMADLENSVWLQAVDQEKILRIADLSEEPGLCPAEQDAVNNGARSMLIAPLRFGGETIGTFHVRTDRTGDLGAVDAEKLRHLAPLFSMALKRGLDDMNNEVQAVIKEKCTAVHPSVEWRFRRAALDHMERIRRGEHSEMEPIIFREVIPLFAQSDIRGSSDVRVQSIQADLTEQLSLAGNVMTAAGKVRPWPLLQELAYRINRQSSKIQTGLSTEEESATAAFLQNEVAAVFDELRDFGPKVRRAIDTYTQAVDPVLGVVYRRRRAFEDSVATLNERLSAYLDQEQALAQAIFPHYFEKHQTDGLDYVIYLGASMHPDGKLSPFYLKNLALWQLMVTCGLAWHTRQVQPELKIPLDTCHLILVNRSPLSIRFRYDEKRFDVDGAYDVRHEIVKSRLDKAVVNGGERLTQPGRIAVVYSSPKEGREIRQHVEYLQSRGYLDDNIEALNLEDLPGVHGLKAMRVAVNLEAESMPQGLSLLAV
ncbi:MAG: GAF domain-containing protein [Pseudomonadota bacterium]